VLVQRCRRLLRPRVTAITVGALAAALLVPASAGAFQAGVNMPNIVAPDSTYVTLQHAGVKVVRSFMTMGDVEPARGQYNQAWLNEYDAWVTKVNAIGARPVIDVVGAPQWASGSTNPNQLPTDGASFSSFSNDYSAFVAAMARRYAGKVAGWEIWNEEDSTLWWPTGPNPASYAQLLRTTYPAVKSADPATRVIVGGLTGNDATYLSGLYSAGGGGSFDTVAVHTDTACNIASPYRFLRDADGSIDQYSFLGYRGVHDVMAAHGDASKPIWMTEMGWSTAPGTCDAGMWAGQKAAGVSTADQATFLSQAFHCLTQDSSMVPVGMVYDLTDSSGSDSKSRFGLETVDGTAKPAFTTLSDYNHRGDQISGACGNFTGPAISPRVQSHYTRLLSISVSASVSTAERSAAQDPTLGVGRITLTYDGGKKIRNFTNSAHPQTLNGSMTWFGAEHLSPGRHTLTILAKDSAGNVSTVTVSFVHGGNGASATGAQARAKAKAKAKARARAKKRHAKRKPHH
jgi:hypothetical protein